MSKEIVVVGSGFAGISAANEIAQQTDYNVTVIDKKGEFFFYPISLKRVSGWAGRDDFQFNAERFLHSNVKLVSEEVIDINPKKRLVATKENMFSFDHLVLCTGGEEMIPSSIEVTYGVEIHSMRHLDQIERALEVLKDKKEVVVLGGGASGCELAAELANLRGSDLDFDITIIESSDRLVPGLRPETSEKVERELLEIGVVVVKDFPVTKITEYQVQSGDDHLPHDLLFNALGVKAASPGDIATRALSSNPGRELVANHYGQVKPYKRIWGAGDCIKNEDENKNIVQNSAQAAEELGRAIAKNIVAYDEKEELSKISFRDKGTFVPLGEGRCVLEAPFVSVQGKLVEKAWWLFYGSKMPDTKSKLNVMKRAFIKPSQASA